MKNWAPCPHYTACKKCVGRQVVPSRGKVGREEEGFVVFKQTELCATENKGESTLMLQVDSCNGMGECSLKIRYCQTQAQHEVPLWC